MCMCYPKPVLRARLFAAFLLIAVAAASTGAAARAQTSGLTMSVRAGFDGYYKDGMWIPIRITLANDGPDASGSVVIAAPRYDGSTVDYVRPVELPGGSRKEVNMFVSVEGYVGKISVAYMSGGTQLATASARITQATTSDLLYGVLAASPSTFNVLTRGDPINGQGRVAQLSVEDLPSAAVAWRALDLLIISDVDTGQLSAEQKDAMRAWVAGGGRLIVAGGPSWQKTALGLGDLLPFAPSGAQTVTGLESMVAYALEAGLDGSAIAATGNVSPGATVTVSASSPKTPLVVEGLHGYGRVTFFAFDPSLEPFRRWAGMEGVYRNLLSQTSERPGWSGPYRNWYNAGEAVNAIPGIGLPHVLQVCVFLGGYVFAVGPLNYLILRRLKRRELAWLTIPGMVVLFTAITYFASFGLRGTRATLHRLTVAQVWENSDRAQVETLVGIFSPRRSEYDLQVDGDVLLRPLPSDMYYGTVDTSLTGARIEQSDTSVIRNVRVDVGAIKPFVAQGQIAAPKFSSSITYSVIGSQSVLEGKIANLSEITLHDAVVLAFGGYQTIGDVPAGGEVEVNIPFGAYRATWTVQSPNQILPPGVSSPYGFPGGHYSGYDSTIENILGTVSYYDNRETYRRYSMLTWMFDPYSSGGRGSGTYLVGWTDESPVNASLVGDGFNTADQTMYIVRLNPQMVVSTGAIAVPPGLMTWELIDPDSGGGGSPYDSYLSQGYFSLRFRPFTRMEYQRVGSLTLNLLSYGATGTAPLTLSLWDQQEGVWVAQPNLNWGSTLISAPGRFVASDGHIDVRVENSSFQNSVSIESLDFSLVVER